MASELKLGTAEVKITPPVGIPMAGYYSRRDSEGVLDDIYAKAVVEAHRRRTPARVSYGSEHETKLSFIRRFWMKDGTVGWNPGVKNPNIGRPIGAIDPEVNVVYAETIGRAKCSSLRRFGCLTSCTPMPIEGP